MAEWYVDARNGNDSNTGADWANAKKTIQAMVTAAAAYELIHCTGVFYESVSQSKHTRIQGEGHAVLDGKHALDTGVAISGNGILLSIKGFTIRQYTHGIYTTASPGFTTAVFVEDCIIEDCTTNGFWGNAAQTRSQFIRCVFRDCAYGLQCNTTMGLILINCTIAGCTSYGVYIPATNALYRSFIVHCIFYTNLHHIYTPANAYLEYSDKNDIDFGTGDCYYLGVQKTSIADWRTATGWDAKSISANPLFVDYARKMFRLKTTSPAVIRAQILGAYPYRLAEAVTNDINATIWDNPVTITDVVKDGSGHYVLDGAATEGVVEFEIDYGALPRNIRNINLAHDYAGLGSGVGGGPNGILDYDETDTLPETWEYRIAVDTGSGYGAYSEIALFNNASLDGILKIKIEATLRSDA